MFIEVLFIMAKKWQQAKCPCAVEWIDELWYI